MVEKLANMYNVPWMVENPVGALSTLWRKPDFIFNPCAYGGYLPEDDKHPAFPEYIAARDAYTKKTCIWCGNGFKQPLFRPVPMPDEWEDSKQHAKLGGKSKRTKMIRSLTPRGFARAVFWLTTGPSIVLRSTEFYRTEIYKMAPLRDADHIMALFVLFTGIHFVYFKHTKCSLKIRQR